MGAHPPAADEAPAYPGTGSAEAPVNRRFGCAPSHARVLMIHRSNGATYPICGPRPLPDVPAGRILPSELGGPRRRKWRGIDSDFLTEGEGGERLAIARLGRVPSWPRTEHSRRARGPLRVESRHTRSWDHTRQTNQPSHARECSVSTNTPVSGRASGGGRTLHDRVDSLPGRDEKAKGRICGGGWLSQHGTRAVKHELLLCVKSIGD